MQAQKISIPEDQRPSTVADVRRRINEALPVLAAEAVACDELGQLTPKVYETLRDSGVMRVLQPKEHGGIEGDPVAFCELVM